MMASVRVRRADMVTPWFVVSCTDIRCISTKRGISTVPKTGLIHTYARIDRMYECARALQQAYGCVKTTAPRALHSLT